METWYEECTVDEEWDSWEGLEVPWPWLELLGEGEEG